MAKRVGRRVGLANVFGLVLAVVLLASAPARAFSSGAVGNCASCHSGGAVAAPMLSVDNTCLTASMSTVVHVTAANVNGGGGGWDLSTSAGVLSVGGPDSALTRVSGGDITQSATKPGGGGTVRFSAILTAPPGPTTVNLHVYYLAANANGSTTGDGTGQANLPVMVAAPPACGQASCGQVTNACGQSVSCGTCVAPQTCGGGGAPNVCGSAPSVPASGLRGLVALAALLLGAAAFRLSRKRRRS